MKKFLNSFIIALAIAVFPMAGFAVAQPQRAIEAAAVSEVAIRAVGAGVEIVNPTDDAITVEIFAITGAKAARHTLGAGETETFALPAGIYIVKAADKTARIAIR